MTDVPKALSQPPSLGWASPPWPGLSQRSLESPGEGLPAADPQRSGGSAGVWGMRVPCLCGWDGAGAPCSRACTSLSSLSRATLEGACNKLQCG